MESKALDFAFEGAPMRVVIDGNGNPEFVAADVCAVLGIGAESTRRIPDDEKGLRLVQTLGGTQSMCTLTEPGLYRIVLRSDKPNAEPFRRWVIHDVLPQIRKTGSYQAPQTLEQRALAVLTELQAKVQEQAQQLALQAPAVEAHTVFMSAEGCLSLRDAAKSLGKHPRQWNKELCDRGFLYRNSDGDWRPYSKHMDRGLFRLITIAANGHVRQQALVTPAGMTYFAQRCEQLVLAAVPA
jgi:anti-repressor protein